jgi:hypothetical protein
VLQDKVQDMKKEEQMVRFNLMSSLTGKILRNTDDSGNNKDANNSAA